MTKEDIKKRIETLDESIQWLKANKAEVYESNYIQILDERRKLNKLYNAMNDNPAVAAYGVSQVGKSYMMSSLLQKDDGSQFMVGGYNYISQMNPITKDTEATGVVSRFSSFSQNKSLYSPEHPVLMRTLSVSDIVLVLCEGYYKDLDDCDLPQDVQAISEAIYKRYINNPVVPNSPLHPEDLLEIKFYIGKYVNNAQAFAKSNFFDRIALVADKIPQTDFVNVFSNLWNQNPELTDLFTRILGLLAKLSYSRYIYLPAEALLHNGENQNTILSVECLNGIFDTSVSGTTDVVLRNAGGFTTVPNVSKSMLCALCAEVMFYVEDDFINSSSSYCFDDMPQVSASKLSHKPIKKSILNKMDLLDFPGARSRGGQSKKKLTEVKIICMILLRGKVAYLFNKYSEDRILNVLLYCHDNKQNEVKSIPATIQEWVLNYVGETPEKRADNIRRTAGIPPLFYIATKFNIDMAEDQNPAANEPSALLGRWSSRFTKVLYKECLGADGCADAAGKSWVKDWTGEGVYFQNSYLLRDYKYSGDKGSRLYNGFATEGKETSRMISDEFYNRVRNSFCESGDARFFFRDPSLAWDVAASRNNDGALYIIEQISSIAEYIHDARNHQFSEQLNASSHKVHDLLKDYYVDDDFETILHENIRKARSVLREMDMTCNRDGYYFGHFIQSIQLLEPDVKDQIHSLIVGGSLNEKINDNEADYEIIRNAIGKELAKCTDDKQRWAVLMEYYGFSSQKDAEDYLERKNIDVRRLFSNNFRRKINSVVIADSVYDLWCKKLQSSDLSGDLTGDDSFDAVVMRNLLDNIVFKSQRYKIADVMAEQIAPFTNILSAANINENLVADILAGVISDYIINLGYNYLTEDQLDDVQKVKDKYNLSIYRYLGQQEKSIYEPEELTAIFDRSVNRRNNEALSFSFENNYNRWKEYMFVSFVSDIAIPDYDPVANEELNNILNKLQ